MIADPSAPQIKMILYDPVNRDQTGSQKVLPPDQAWIPDRKSLRDRVLTSYRLVDPQAGKLCWTGSVARFAADNLAAVVELARYRIGGRM